MVSKIAGASLLVSCSLYAGLKTIENTLKCSPFIYEKISQSKNPISLPSYCPLVSNDVLLSVAFTGIAASYYVVGKPRSLPATSTPPPYRRCSLLLPAAITAIAMAYCILGNRR